jgi:opacity protein-like surface antigen
MKNLLFLLVLTLLLYSCASPNKMANESIHNAIIGQNEMIVFERLGTPTRVEHDRDGGKIMIYESQSKGMFLTPYNKPAITYNTTRGLTGKMQGVTYTSNVNTATNDPKYTIHSTNVSYLKVYIDKH